MRLYLVRHGQTAWNAQKRFMGQLDIPLDETGRAQVAALGNRLKDEHVDMIYASDLSRAWDTALAIESCLASHADPSALPAVAGYRIKPDPRLREMNFGDWQGLTYAEIQERDPQNLAHWEEDRLHHTRLQTEKPCLPFQSESYPLIANGAQHTQNKRFYWSVMAVRFNCCLPTRSVFLPTNSGSCNYRTPR